MTAEDAGAAPDAGPGAPLRIAAVLAAVGCVFLGLAIAIAWDREVLREPPPATGQTGVLLAFGQLPDGPLQLHHGLPMHFYRPQHIAFQLKVNGTGPRQVQVELDDGRRRYTMYVARVECPTDGEYLNLPYVLYLDDRFPNALDVIVTVEAPHAVAATSTFPLRLGENPARTPKTATVTPSAPGTASPIPVPRPAP